MRTTITLLVGLLLPVGAASVAHAGPKDDVAAAVKGLADQPSFEWKTTTRSEGAGPFGGNASTTGHIADGYLWVSSTSPQARLEFARKADKVAVVVEGNWMTVEQMAARTPAGRGRGGPAGGGLNLRAIAEFKTPIAQLEDLLGKAVNFSRDGDTVTAELTPDAATGLLNAGAPQDGRGGRGRGRGRGDAQRGGRGFRGPPAVRDTKGTLTFTIKEAQLAQYTVQVTATRELGGNTEKQTRTTTTAFTGFGDTKAALPADAKEILDALITGRAPNVFVPEPGFKKLFNGH
ncbi:MAG: hypothetical protein WD894_12505, partial [Pirellulales bacterium]